MQHPSASSGPRKKNNPSLSNRRSEKVVKRTRPFVQRSPFTRVRFALHRRDLVYQCLQPEIFDGLAEHLLAARRTSVFGSVTSYLCEDRADVLLTVQAIRVQVGDHLDEVVDLSRQRGAAVVQLGVRGHVLGLCRAEPIDEARFAERVTALGETISIRLESKLRAYMEGDAHIRAPHGVRADLARCVFFHPGKDLSNEKIRTMKGKIVKKTLASSFEWLRFNSSTSRSYRLSSYGIHSGQRKGGEGSKNVRLAAS